MVNIRLAALSETEQLAKLCMPIVTKSGFAQKEHNLTDCNGMHL